MSKEIKLSNGGVALVDDEQYELLNSYQWYRMTTSKRKTAYAASRNGSQHPIFMHHLVLSPRFGEEINHINGNSLDNRRENLESVSHHVNIVKHFVNKATKAKLGVKGVYICGSGRFVATIMWKCKRHHIGTFDTLAEASKAYEERKEQLLKQLNITI